LTLVDVRDPGDTSGASNVGEQVDAVLVELIEVFAKGDGVGETA
jgi:hypothetical protein